MISTLEIHSRPKMHPYHLVRDFSSLHGNLKDKVGVVCVCVCVHAGGRASVRPCAALTRNLVVRNVRALATWSAATGQTDRKIIFRYMCIYTKSRPGQQPAH